jgi:hypothetical protein
MIAQPLMMAAEVGLRHGALAVPFVRSAGIEPVDKGVETYLA